MSEAELLSAIRAHPGKNQGEIASLVTAGPRNFIRLADCGLIQLAAAGNTVEERRWSLTLLGEERIGARSCETPGTTAKTCLEHVQATIDRLHRSCGVIDTPAVRKALEAAWEDGRASGSCSTAEAALERAGAAELENMKLRERVKALEYRKS